MAAAYAAVACRADGATDCCLVGPLLEHVTRTCAYCEVVASVEAVCGLDWFAWWTAWPVTVERVGKASGTVV